MTLRDLARSVLGHIRDDSAVQAWCQAQYGKNISLFLGIGGTPDTNPKETDLPLAIVTEGNIIYGAGGKPESATLTLGWEVKTHGSSEEDGIREVGGTKESDDLGELIAAAIHVVEREYSVTSVEMAPATTGEWAPRFPGVMTVSMQLR